MSTTEHTQPTTVPDDPDAQPVPVDQAPERPRTAFDRITAHREGAKQPILVPWLRVAEERTAILRWAIGYAWHIARFHGVRLPVYQLRFILWALRGIGRATRAIVDGLLDAEARPLRRSAVVADDAKTWMTLAKERNARVRHRSAALAVLAIPVLAFVVAMVWLIHGLLFWVCVEALVVLFGALGRPQGAPLVSRATVPLHLAPILRADVVEVALRAVPGLMRKDAVIEFPDPIVKDGPGWLARINLPHGVTPADVMGKRPALASGLRRPLGCVCGRRPGRTTVGSLTCGSATRISPPPASRSTRCSRRARRTCSWRCPTGRTSAAGRSA